VKPLKCLLAAIFLLTSPLGYAGSATWNLNPSTNNWDTADNWTPATVPYGENDIATFGVSNTTNIILGDTPSGEDAINEVNGIVFSAGASAYTMTLAKATLSSTMLIIHSGGIVNNSGVTQNFVAPDGGTGDSARIYIQDDGYVGDNVVITNEGGSRDYGAFTQIGFGAGDEPNAGNATYINEGATAAGTIYGGTTDLLFFTNAENATFINNAGTVADAAAGYTLVQVFPPGGHLGTSTFIANAATVPGAEGGWAEMDVGVCEGTQFIANGATFANCQAGQIYFYGAEYNTGNGVATFIGNGGNGSNAEGGLIDLFALPRSDQTFVVANRGTNGGLGGDIVIEGNPLLDLGQFQLFGNGTLDLINATGIISIGSLAGSGLVLLDGHSLSVGSNNLSTTFTGSIQEGGTVIKAGTGTLTLTGANTQTGGTTINAGVLIANNRRGSATGTGKVNVKAGTFGGKGIIAGAVTIGTGSGNGAFLAPSAASNQPLKFTLKNTLTFKADSTYTYKLNTRNTRADQVTAKGVTIQSGAQFNFEPVANKKLTNGTVVTVINNTAGTAISGTFASLPDGSTLTAGRNNYQVNYEGGDGNDLTLTVVP
jgi:autotransporter-associated beta strand protein